MLPLCGVLLALVAVAGCGDGSGEGPRPAGALDPTFGRSGVVTTAFPPAGRTLPTAVLVQPDGKIVVAGVASNRMVIARYEPNGILDAGFGTAGVTMTGVGTATGTIVEIALLPDGRVVAAGWLDGQHDFGERVFALVRYTPLGVLDATFGTEGIVTTQFAGFTSHAATVVLQPDGKIVAVASFEVADGNGVESTFYTLVRYDADGERDATFGNNGGQQDLGFGPGGLGSAIASQPDGRLLVVGRAMDDIAVGRYTADGRRDAAFGDGGIALAGIGPNPAIVPLPASGKAVAVLPDGKILVTGTALTRSSSELSLARFTSTGALDASFGDSGTVETDFGVRAEGADMALQADGKVVVVGSGPQGLIVVRFAPDGAFDSTFGDGGVASVPSAVRVLGAMALQPDGKIVVVGASEASTGASFGILRFLP